MARYNGPANAADSAVAIAVDGSGHVYVAGDSWGGDTTRKDYATVKYGKAGNQLWVRRYSGPGNGLDEAYAIAADGSGNVYVTGYSRGVGNYDYATIKYDSAGNQLWVARYDGGFGHDRALAMAVDGSGNIYVTGWSSGEETGTDYATVKYDAVGTELWVARYNGPASSSDEAHGIAVDASGNIYITGWSDGGVTSSDYATIKYDSAGNQLWAARYDGPASSYDQAQAIAVDASGNAYVTGFSYGEATKSDYATIKYDSAGNQLWARRYDGPASSYDQAQAIAVDASGNAYLTGFSDGGETSDDYATIKYNSAGNQLWVARYDGAKDGDQPHAIAVDASGNAYVTGLSYSQGRGDYATIKYDNAGNQLWVRRYNGPWGAHDEASAIAVDGSSVYVTGRSEAEKTGPDYVTVKGSQTEEPASPGR